MNKLAFILVSIVASSALAEDCFYDNVSNDDSPYRDPVVCLPSEPADGIYEYFNSGEDYIKLDTAKEVFEVMEIQQAGMPCFAGYSKAVAAKLFSVNDEFVTPYQGRVKILGVASTTDSIVVSYYSDENLNRNLTIERCESK